MNTLTLELLSSLLSNLENEAIGQLSITSKNMRNITNKLKDDAIFYKSRVENLLGYFINSSYKGNWKKFYSILIKLDPSKSYWLSNALLSAAKNKNNLAIKVLLTDQRADPSADDNSAIRKASENGHTEVVKLLLEDKRVDPSVDNNYAIRWASIKGHIEIMKLLIEDQRVDPSADNNYAIRWASVRGHLEVVKLLLADQRRETKVSPAYAYAVDPSADNNYAIRWASVKGHLEVVKLLLADQRVDPSADNNYAIRWASVKGHLEVVKLLLGSNKINLSIKTQFLKELQLKRGSSKLSHDMNYDNIERLAKIPLRELIQIGNQNLQDRQIIMTKYFWWLRLEKLHNMDNIKEDPFKLVLQLEQ